MERYSLKSIYNQSILTRQASPNTFLTRVVTNESRSVSPILCSKKNASRNKIPEKFSLKFGQKRYETPVPRSEPPYIIFRNGVPMLFTPSASLQPGSGVLAPFSSNLKGYKIRHRNHCGNMFAVKSTETIKEPSQIATSYLNLHSKLSHQY